MLRNVWSRLEKETDGAEQMVSARRVGRVVQRELVIHFQNQLRRREKSEANGVKLPATLAGWQILITSAETASLQILVSVTIKRHQLPAIAHDVAKVDVIRRFERDTPHIVADVVGRIAVVVRAEISRRAHDCVHDFPAKFEPGLRHPIADLAVK